MQNVELSLAVFGELFDRLSPDEDFFPPPTGHRAAADTGRRPPGRRSGRGPSGPDGRAWVFGPPFEPWLRWRTAVRPRYRQLWTQNRALSSECSQFL